MDRLWRPPYACFFCVLYWGRQLTLFAYYMGAPSDQFLLIQYGGPSQISFFACYRARPPQICFFTKYSLVYYKIRHEAKAVYSQKYMVSFSAYYMGRAPLRLVSLLYEAPSDQFLCIPYGRPLRSVSSLTIWRPPQINLFAYYVGAPSEYFFRILYGRASSGQFLRLL